MATPDANNLFGPSSGSTPQVPSGGGVPGAIPSAPALPDAHNLFGHLGAKIPKAPNLPAAPGAHSAPAPVHHGGGGIGGFFSGIGSSIGHAAHYADQQLGVAGHTIEAGAVGTAHIVQDALKPTPGGWHGLLHDWEHPFSGPQGLQHLAHPLRPVPGDAFGNDLRSVLNPNIYKQVAAHPGRNLLLDGLLALPFLNAGGKLVDAGVEAGRTGSVVAAAKRLVPGADARPRFLRMGEDGAGPHASKQPLPRYIQHVHDTIVNHALKNNPEGKVAAYGAKRIGWAKQETARTLERMHQTIETQIGAGAKRVAREAGRTNTPHQVLQDALHLTSTNDLPENAVKFHEDQVVKHEEAAAKAEDKLPRAKSQDHAMKLHEQIDMHKAAITANEELAQRFQAVADHGVVKDTVGKDGKPSLVIDASRFPHTAKVDAKIAEAQGQMDKIARERLGMTDAALRSRVDAENRVRAGAEYVKPTKARLGIPNAAHRVAAAEVASAERRSIKAEAKVAKAQARLTKARAGGVDHLIYHHEGNVRDALMNQSRRADELAAARARFDQLEARRVSRMRPTGLVGGEGARPGRNYLSGSISKSTRKQAALAGGGGDVTGEATPFISSAKSMRYTGEGLRRGLIPSNTIESVLRHVQAGHRYLNTDDYRQSVVKTGSAVKRSARDVLVTIPHADKVEKLTEADKQALGQKVSTVEQKVGEARGYEAWLHDQIPGLKDKFASDNAKAIGAHAPAGRVWVDKRVLGDIAKDTGGGHFKTLGRGMDEINAGITAGTVYLKAGHVSTRFGTNFVTNLLQGSANPYQWGYAAHMWAHLDQSERMKAMAAAGQRGYEAMPAAEGTVVGRTAKFGSKMWAKFADAMFRFNSITYEARKAGFDNPDKFRAMLDQLENPHDHPSMSAADHAKIDWVVKRADRAAIAYDNLTAAEKAVIARLIWFYPWAKGSTSLVGHTIAEHPYKSALLGQAGAQGIALQQKDLGNHPSYTWGLLPFGGGSNPAVSDLSTFNPASTLGNVLASVSHDSGGGLAGMASPVWNAIDELAHGRNDYGQALKNPIASALQGAVGTIPAAQIIAAAIHGPNAAKPRMYSNTPTGELMRGVFGSWWPRHYNTAVGNKDYGLETTGR